MLLLLLVLHRKALGLRLRRFSCLGCGWLGGLDGHRV
jgi:hypothetical protein